MPADSGDFLCYHWVFQWIEPFTPLIVISPVFVGKCSQICPVNRLSFLDFVMLRTVPFTSSSGAGMPHLFFWLAQPAEGDVRLVNHSAVCLSSCGRHGRS